MWDDYYMKPLPRYYRKKIYGEQAGAIGLKAGMAAEAKKDAFDADEIRRYGRDYHYHMELKRLKAFIKKAENSYKKNKNI